MTTGEATWYGRVNFDAKEETDHGTLRSYIRMESTGGDNTTEATYMFATLTLSLVASLLATEPAVLN